MVVCSDILQLVTYASWCTEHRGDQLYHNAGANFPTCMYSLKKRISSPNHCINPAKNITKVLIPSNREFTSNVSQKHVDSSLSKNQVLISFATVIIHYYYNYMQLDLQKPSQMAQELKSKLKPNINDTLMHCPEGSTTWL